MGIPSGNRVEMLRVRGSRLDPLQAGLRAERALAQTELCPPGLRKDAVLIVRRLHDPMPGTLRLRRADERPSPAWQQALRGRVVDLMQEAARPAHGAVPAASNAVLFAAHSELLACLARDWCDGTLISRWWWRELLRHPDVSRMVLEYWLSTPEYVPAAIELLDRGGDAARFVSVLTTADVLSLLDRVAETHGLVALMPVLERMGSKRLLSHGENGRVAAPQRNYEASQDPASVVLDPTALQFLPQAVARQLTASQCVLLDVCLGLRRAPVVVRSDAYAAAIVTVPKVCDDATDTDALVEKISLTFSLERKDDGIPAADEPALGENRCPGTKGHKGKAARFALTPTISHGDQQTNNTGTAEKQVEEPKPTTALLTTPSSAQDKPVRQMVDTRIVQTRLGGAFYLINLGLFLDLYGDFTSPLRPGIALPIWDFIALITAQLLGRRFRRDALWPLLAELAARPVKQPPGASFEPPDEWRMPESWLAPFRQENLQAISDGERLRVFHPAGFLVLDVAIDLGDPGMQLARELSPYLQVHRTSAGPKLEASPARYDASKDAPLQRWLGWLMPYVRARLAVALGIHTNRKVGRMLCCHEAKVALTAAHLDITFALAALPIEIRVSGLDRDPGWVPAAGRVIRFHYE